MKDPSIDLRDYEVSQGDLVLMVNESYNRFNLDDKPADGTTVILTKFNGFVSAEREANTFMGLETKYINEPIELVPGFSVPSVKNGRSSDWLFTKADRIYIGTELVEYGLRSDPVISQWLNPQ